MAKISGLGWTELSIDDAGGSPQDIRNDITNFNFATPRGVQDVTGIDKSAMERLLLLADFSIDISGVFNSAANMSHAVLSTVPSDTTPTRSVTIEIDSQELDNECMFTDYALTRAQSGEFTWSSTGVLSDGEVPTWS
ncbi:MAG: hypothetical protein S0880_10280 [Actinomycetota bacterium]|nr:hypothetical protein [Actinomycetota bacterium]